MHKAEVDVIPQGLEKGYPETIDFSALPGRIRVLKPGLERVLEPEIESYFRTRVENEFKRGQNHAQCKCWSM